MTTIEAKHRQKKQKSSFGRVFMPLLLVILGLAVMLYPVISSQWNNYLQREAAAQYDALTKEADPVVLNQEIEEARIYNRESAGRPIFDPWLARVTKDNKDYQDYLKQLDQLPSMSQVVIPSIDSNLPMYHGTEESTLQKGLGHLFGTSLPVGGPSTHAVITGHTGITNATLWDNLIDIKKGDAIYVSTFGEHMKYEVHEIETVLPDETDGLEVVEGQDLITLITCTPYGINSHRLLVHAHRVAMDPEEAKVFEESGFKMQWWMWAVLAVALIAILLMSLWVWRTLRKNKKNDEPTEEADLLEAEASVEGEK